MKKVSSGRGTKPVKSLSLNGKKQYEKHDQSTQQNSDNVKVTKAMNGGKKKKK